MIQTITANWEWFLLALYVIEKAIKLIKTTDSVNKNTIHDNFPCFAISEFEFSSSPFLLMQ